ncbi:MAG: insulinase family protein [Burkholderiales bacterium]|nr:insulinase family protein [Burkholderiales bacterium]
MKLPLTTFVGRACAVLLLGAGAALAAAPAAPPSGPPASSSASPAAAPGTTQFTLANGLTVLVKPDHRAPTAVQMLVLRVGSVDEVDGTSGVAHVLEHMMFKGTKTLAPGEFSRRVAALGGRENAFTMRDATGYHQQIPANRLEEVMALEADRFANNQWPDDEFRRELEVVKEERRMRTDDSPRARLYEQMNAMVFTASPYRRPIIGWMDDLDVMTPQDAREFHARWYVPANAVLVVAGDVEPERVRELAERYYGGIPARAVPVRKPRNEPPQQGMRRLDYKAPAEQAYVSLAWRVPKVERLDDASAEDALALTVLSAVLDGYPGARLERTLVRGESRVADSAGAYNGLWGRGPQVFIMDGVPAPGRTAEELEAALRAQVARVAKDGISEAELARVKTQWTASEVYKLDSVMNQARELASYWVMGMPPDTGERIIERLRAVTAEQVRSVAARYFGDDQLTVAILRPQPMQGGRKPRAPMPGAHGTGDMR